MNDPPAPPDPPAPRLGPDDPPPDFSREEAAYAKEEERLARDHLGKIALVHNDDVVGVFDDPDQAILEAFRLFGDVKVMITEIRDPKEPPPFVGTIDPYHPSVKLLGRNDKDQHGEIHGGRG